MNTKIKFPIFNFRYLIYRPIYSKGFTLIELLVVISIIGMLSSVVLASLSGARAKGKMGAANMFASHTYQAFGTFMDSAGASGGGYWTFDDPSGLLDSSGNGNTISGIGVGGVSRTESVTHNNQGASLQFTNNANTCINAGNKTTLRLSSGTIGAWIKTSDKDTFKSIVVKPNAFSFVIYNATGKLAVYKYQVPAQWIESTTNSPALHDNNWHYVAFSFKPSSVGKSQFYVDGSAVWSPFDFNVYDQAGNVFIGSAGCSVGFNNFINGNIDDVAIYPQALTANEIQKIYAEGLPRHQFAQAE